LGLPYFFCPYFCKFVKIWRKTDENLLKHPLKKKVQNMKLLYCLNNSINLFDTFLLNCIIPASKLLDLKICL
jgi:hypothetical protein